MFSFLRGSGFSSCTYPLFVIILIIIIFCMIYIIFMIYLVQMILMMIMTLWLTMSALGRAGSRCGFSSMSLDAPCNSKSLDGSTLRLSSLSTRFIIFSHRNHPYHNIDPDEVILVSSSVSTAVVLGRVRALVVDLLCC